MLEPVAAPDRRLWFWNHSALLRRLVSQVFAGTEEKP
jgi:hypothetical protein